MAFLFALVLIPAYSLIHEAEHTMLHPNPKWNDWLGRWLCTLFVVSFTFLQALPSAPSHEEPDRHRDVGFYLEHQQKWKRTATFT